MIMGNYFGPFPSSFLLVWSQEYMVLSSRFVYCFCRSLQVNLLPNQDLGQAPKENDIEPPWIPIFKSELDLLCGSFQASRSSSRVKSLDFRKRARMSARNQLPQTAFELSLHSHPLKEQGLDSPTKPNRDYYGLSGPIGICLALIESLPPLSLGPFEVWDP